MEEYQTKRKYLHHLKKIAQLREGMGKLPIFPSNLPISRSKTKQSFPLSPKTLLTTNSIQQLKHHTSTQRIMRSFMLEKQNTRLVTKILKMNSSIPMKKYEEDYQKSKKYQFKLEKGVKKRKYVSVKFFDICFVDEGKTNPEDYFKLFLIEDQKKMLLLKDTLFQIRQKQLKLRKKAEIVIKIEGKNHEGIIRFSENNLIDITKHGQKVGYAVLQHIKR